VSTVILILQVRKLTSMASRRKDMSPSEARGDESLHGMMGKSEVLHQNIPALETLHKRLVEWLKW
jgi:hypothetical protein